MTVHTLSWDEFPDAMVTGGCVTIGNFDGVHRGHAALVETAKRLANVVQGPTVVVTFDPPPVALLNPPALKTPLSTLEDRVEALSSVGADHVVFLQTTPSLLALSAEAFFEDVLVRQLRAKAIVEGFNFCFGHARGGNVELLRRLCSQAGLLFEEVPALLMGGEPVSSSRVRDAIQRGDVSLATQLLGRNYAISGEVVTGAMRGRTIGFPTANLDRIVTLIPATGVYAVWATVDGQRYPAAGNIGPNPTFGEDARKIEIHLLDFQGDLYGQSVKVEFVSRLRETRPFTSVDALKAQLAEDVRQARVILKSAQT